MKMVIEFADAQNKQHVPGTYFNPHADITLRLGPILWHWR